MIGALLGLWLFVVGLTIRAILFVVTYFDYAIIADMLCKHIPKGLHPVFVILIFIGVLGAWWALSNLVHFGKIFPFKIVGILFSAWAIAFWKEGLLDSLFPNADMIWKIFAIAVSALILFGVRYFSHRNADTEQ